MSVFELFVLSAALGTDLFSVAVPIGMNKVRRLVIIQSAVVFAIFHIMMILVGYHIGHWLGSIVEHVGAYHIDWQVTSVQNVATIIGAVVLAGLGANMIKDNLRSQQDMAAGNPLRGAALIVLAASVSVDALAAGFSLGMIDVDLLRLSLILGIVIFAIGVLGLGLGRKLGGYIGARAELMGGIILVILGIHILWTTIC
ncbi:manganese efflux pump MntP family protein [Sporomusa acidovorans]|uniref:Manganese efflux pump MntP n=1 Tax=Sporomusa acidovorans (strain ATCC 49682 / DSM 3132 / Mol) TaxID=1123286 RepID=A0ABZ3J801_SPOA4|nr:manganese efflux pump [Sporomusa acidovorans]OZC21200.1 putative manganese efflux pump MntP [Sporomusa acidovorans DSM 3132]SDE64550.1 Putative Mn2+ efflux pump MntP [Sporomusa acidovorans]